MENKKEIDVLIQKLQEAGYICDRSTAVSIYLAQVLQKPLLIEGPAGVGKTEVAKVLSKLENTPLIRLQCYEGLDQSQALYEWNYQHQLLYLKQMETRGEQVGDTELFNVRFLLERPLLKALNQSSSPILLIDEIDRADEEFESFLLEVLSDWQISIPEIGTVKAKSIPRVIVTGNRTRELSEALRRRCLYLWIDFPSFEKELKIVKEKVPKVDVMLAEKITAFMQELRTKNLNKVPGVAESVDWARALANMHFDHLNKEIVEQTLGVILKDWSDMRETQMSLSELLERVGVISKMDGPA
ncbi:MoxR family ATPase [Marinilongibacter aquaticus]|uniref:AAA family ATPase n=1 Tax=Marinilongibacter aquaticus TaxID=2975157 RepID=UPI0021BD80CB|nr:MoxR family ATPase [Marinilongibacter aquaticus]UBM57423.1 MoxR family ATPase [Marinilongibacter aquaticus]